MTFSNSINPKLPCSAFAKNGHDKDNAVQCDLCEHWIQIKCNNLNYLDHSTDIFKTVMNPGTA